MAEVKNLLPVGTVVLNKDAEKKLMIIGILVENNGTRYDYIAVPYPEGFINAETLYAFNHEDIQKVEFIGYMDAEFQLFRGTVADVVGKEEK